MLFALAPHSAEDGAATRGNAAAGYTGVVCVKDRKGDFLVHAHAADAGIASPVEAARYPQAVDREDPAVVADAGDLYRKTVWSFVAI
jgi:hypothetical protein